jgi:hypothetical protein
MNPKESIDGGARGGGGGNGGGEDVEMLEERNNSATDRTMVAFSRSSGLMVESRPGNSNATSSGPDAGNGREENALENVDSVLCDYMNKLGSRISIVESELRYAWKALDLLSQEYVIMWRRMEKAESLLSQQQAVIAKMMEEQVQQDRVQEGKGPARRKDGGDGNGDGGGGGGSANGNGSGGGGTSRDDGTSSSQQRTLGGGSNRASRTPDEAFYRSLNFAHQDDNEETELGGGEQELGLIWEEDAELIEKGSSGSPPDPAPEALPTPTTSPGKDSTFPRSSTTTTSKGSESEVTTGKKKKLVFNEDSFEEVGKNGTMSKRASSSLDFQVDRKVRKLDTGEEAEGGDKEESHGIFSSMDYKDYLGSSQGSPPVSEKDLKDLEELSAISSLETRDIIDNLDRHGVKAQQLLHQHKTSSSSPSKLPSDSSKSPTKVPSSDQDQTLATTTHTTSSPYESPQRRKATKPTTGRPKPRTSLEESFRLLYADIESDLVDSSTSASSPKSQPSRDDEYLYSSKRSGDESSSSPVPMDVSSDRGSSVISSTRAISPTSRAAAASALNDYILGQELLIQEALREVTGGSSYLADQGRSTNYDTFGAGRLGTSSYEQSQLSSSSGVPPSSQAMISMTGSQIIAHPEGYMSGRPTSPCARGFSSSSPYTLGGVSSPAKSPHSSRRTSPRTSLYFSEQGAVGRYPDSHESLVIEGTAAALQMPTRVNIPSPTPDFSPMNDLSISVSSTSVRKTPTGFDTGSLGADGTCDSINIRPSPKSPKPSKGTLMHARSDSGVSEMSNWSSIEKSPTSPSRYGTNSGSSVYVPSSTSYQPQSTGANLHAHLQHSSLSPKTITPIPGGRISPRPGGQSAVEFPMMRRETDFDSRLPDVTIGAMPPAHDEPRELSTSSFRTESEIPPDLTTTNRLSPLTSRGTMNAGVRPVSPSGKVYDVQTDMDFQRQDMVAMALARERERERDLITGSSAIPSVSAATMGLDSLYKNSSTYPGPHSPSNVASAVADSNASVADGLVEIRGPQPEHSVHPQAYSTSSGMTTAPGRNRWNSPSESVKPGVGAGGGTTPGSFHGRDMGTKSTRPYFPGSDSDDSSVYSYRESSHYHTRVKHVVGSQSGPYSPYEMIRPSTAMGGQTGPPGRHHYSPSTYEMEREREFLDREMRNRGLYSNEKNFYAPQVPTTYYTTNKYACYENPSYTVTEPGELKWSQEHPLSHHQHLHQHRQYASKSVPGPNEMQQQNILGSMGEGNYGGAVGDTNFPTFRPQLSPQPPHLQQMHHQQQQANKQYGMEMEYSHKVPPSGTTVPQNYGVISASQVTPGGPCYDVREQYYGHGQPPGGYLQSRAGYVSISASGPSGEMTGDLGRIGSGSPSATSSLKKNKLAKRSSSLKSAMNSMGKWVQQDLHITLPKKERSRSLSDSDKPDIQKQYDSHQQHKPYSSSASATPAGTTGRKKKRHSMSIVSNIATLVHKAKKWSSQSEDSEASESEPQYRGGYYRPKTSVDSSPSPRLGRQQYLGVSKPPTARGSRSYEASESDLSESSLFPKVKSTRRTMSEGSGTETDTELDRLPDLAQELFPTIGEAKKPGGNGDGSGGGGGGSGGSGSGSRRSSMNLEKHQQQQGSPLASPNGDGSVKFPTMGPPSGMEFAASRAVGKYRQRQAANGANGTSINNRHSSHQPGQQLSRADSLPPPRPPPPFSSGMSMDMDNVETDESRMAQSETTLGDDETTINYPGEEDEEMGEETFKRRSSGEQLEGQQAGFVPADEQVFSLTGTRGIEVERETSHEKMIQRAGEEDDVGRSGIFQQIGPTFGTVPSSAIQQKQPSEQIANEIVSIHGPLGFSPGETMTGSEPTVSSGESIFQRMESALPTPRALGSQQQSEESGILSTNNAREMSESRLGPETTTSSMSVPEMSKSMAISPSSIHSVSPSSGLSSSFPTIRTSPQQQQYTTSPSQQKLSLQHQSSLSNKSFGDSDMGSSSDSAARTSLSSKNRLDLPSQRTLSEEEDTRSTHSYRSSRVSSRRQSTEESIDSEDEWYKYELRKLEELEKQQMAAIESQPTSISNIPQTQLRFQQYTYVNAMGGSSQFPLNQYPSAPTSATVDMKERMNLVLQELLIKTSNEPQSSSSGSALGQTTDQQGGDVSPSPPTMERRLSLTKSQRSLNREDSLVDEPLGYVSRRRTNSHEDYEIDQDSSESCSTIWKQAEHRPDSGRGSLDYGSMIEPPPAEIGIRIGIAIESSKKQHQQHQQPPSSGLYYQDSSSIKSSESAFYSGGDQTRDTTERPSISLPSSSSQGENVWHSERKGEDGDEDEEESPPAKGGKGRNGTSSGETSGPDTPQESFEEDEMQIAKEEEMIRKHLQLHADDQDEDRGEEDEDVEERRERRHDEVEHHEFPQDEQEGTQEEFIDTNGFRSSYGGGATTSSNIPFGGGDGSGSGPGTGVGTPVELSRRESTQSATLSMSRKFFDIFSVSELKKIGSEDEMSFGNKERRESGFDATTAAESAVPMDTSVNESDNKVSGMSMDEECMGDGSGGPLGSKWGFLKTLKEKKAEEKTNAAAVAQLQNDILVITKSLATFKDGYCTTIIFL